MLLAQRAGPIISECFDTRLCPFSLATQDVPFLIVCLDVNATSVFPPFPSLNRMAALARLVFF